MPPARRIARILFWLAALSTAVWLCAFIARRVPPEEGGLMPAAILLLALGAFALRRGTAPRSRRTG